jgi:hypothetical protein
MTNLPDTGNAPVVRADFSDDAAWAEIQEAISAETEEGFLAAVEFVEDRALVGLDVPALVRAFPRAYPHEYEHPVVFVVDAVTVSSPERPILVIGLNNRDAAEPFRVVPEELHAIENNLSLSNMDFFEFADTARRGDGIFRGF